MYLKQIALQVGERPATDNTSITHHYARDGRMMIQFNGSYYSFRLNDTAGTAKVRDGLIDEPGDVDNVPFDVLLYLKVLGYRVLGAELNGDVLDADESVPEAYEIWV